MDFKVAGTKEFVTAIQLDTKLDGIPASVLASALTQAKEVRLHILDVMNEAIDAPDEMSPHAPADHRVKIPVDQIGAVIGPKGKMINQIQDETGAEISIEDDGTIYIGATDGPKAEAARAMINGIANPTMPEVGERYLGTVVKTTTFGAFVSLVPGRDGLLHISKLRQLAGGKRVDNVEDVVKVGDKVQVQIAEIDPAASSRWSRCDADGSTEAPAPATSTRRRRAARARPEDQKTRTLDQGDGGGGLVRRTVSRGVAHRHRGDADRALGDRRRVGGRRLPRRGPSLAGASHYLEHLLFKGTRRRDALTSPRRSTRSAGR